MPPTLTLVVLHAPCRDAFATEQHGAGPGDANRDDLRLGLRVEVAVAARVAVQRRAGQRAVVGDPDGRVVELAA